MYSRIKDFYNRYEEIINYLIVGGLTTVVSIGTYLLFANTLFSAKSDIDIQIANVLSWVFAVVFAYITNRKFVFKSKTIGNMMVKEASNFVFARIFSLIVEIVLMFLFYSVMGINDGISKIICQVVVVIMNYVLSKLIIFKK